MLHCIEITALELTIGELYLRPCHLMLGNGVFYHGISRRRNALVS